MLLYSITDRRQLGRDFLSHIGDLIQAGVDLIQIREKDLSAKELLALSTAATHLPNRTATRILVNSRVDVAMAAEADGVHLPADSLRPGDVRAVAGEGFLVAVSCHSLEEVRRAEEEGAGVAVFGPVFDTPSKRVYGPPQGLNRLETVCAAVQVPVLALGGVTIGNARECLRAGAAGVAAISLFQQAHSLPQTVSTLRALGKK